MCDQKNAINYVKNGKIKFIASTTFMQIYLLFDNNDMIFSYLIIINFLSVDTIISNSTSSIK